MNDRPPAPGTLFAVTGASVNVSHDSCTAIGTSPPDVVVLRQPDVSHDTLTRIEIWPDNGKAQTVLLLWERHPASDKLGLLLCWESRTLFLGAGSFAAAVSLKDRKIVDEHTVFLFWGYQQCGEYVIELGELSCYLRTLSGEVLAEASVDPPYDMSVTAEGIRFESIVMGTQWLHFPKSPHRSPN